MRILYVAPHPPSRTGVADYAYHFREAVEHNLQAKMEWLNICQDENIDRPRSFLALRDAVRSLYEIKKYDVVHLEIGNGQNREFYILYFVKKYHPEARVIVTLHDPPRALSAPMSFIGLEDMPRIVRGVRRSLDLTAGRCWERKVLETVDRIVVLTEAGKRKTESLLGKEVTYLPFLCYGLNRQSKRCESVVERILFFGHLGSKKGIDILIQAFARLLHSNPSYEHIKLYVCGGLPERQRGTRLSRYLHKLPVELGISGNVVFTGRITEDEKDIQFKSADILVLPYRKDNTFGASAVLIEGMSYGLPIIVANVKSFSTEIEDGVTGVLFEDGNIEMLAERMKTLIDDRELRQRLGKNAIAHILEEHSQGYVAKKMGQVYLTVA